MLPTHEETTNELLADVDKRVGINIWGGKKCTPKNQWVSDSDDSDKLRRLHPSDEEKEMKKNARPPIVEEE